MTTENPSTPELFIKYKFDKSNCGSFISYLPESNGYPVRFHSVGLETYLSESLPKTKGYNRKNKVSMTLTDPISRNA